MCMSVFFRTWGIFFFDILFAWFTDDQDFLRFIHFYLIKICVLSEKVLVRGKGVAFEAAASKGQLHNDAGGHGKLGNNRVVMEVV